MYAALSLEWIGHNTDTYVTGKPAKALGWRPVRNPWVAAIVGHSERYGLERRFEQGRIDYVTANGNGSRGVMVHWLLPEGLYEVREFRSWRDERRYFVASVYGHMIRISRTELDDCLRGDAPRHLLPADVRPHAAT